MPRLMEMPQQQRQSTRVPLRLKPSACSEANSLPRAAMDRSSKIENRRSPRTALQEKKRGSRMADLETKLDQTMEELKKLKKQVALEESAKRDVQKKIEKTKEVVAFSLSGKTVQGPDDLEDKKENLLPVDKDSDSSITITSEENGSHGESESAESLNMAEVRAKLAEKMKELENVVAEKEAVKREAEEAVESSSAERKKKEEIEMKLAGAEEELRQSKATVEQMKEKMEAQEGERAFMEAEMKRLRIQTDQWRKASEAAASILTHESFRSVKPVITGAETDDGASGEKRRGSGGGIRVLGELWKKKGQQK